MDNVDSKYKLLFECALDMIFLIDITGNIADANYAAVNVYGYTRKELLSMNVKDLRIPSERAVANKQLLDAFEKGSVYGTTHMRKDGSVFPVEISSRGLMLKGKQMILGVVRDITERKRIERELGKSEEKLRSTFNQAAVGIAHVAVDGRFIRLNKKYCDIVGYSHDELLGLTFQSITHPDDLDKDLINYDRLLKGEVNSYSIEKRYIRKDGSVVWVYLTVSMAEPGNHPDYFIAVVEDITERKRTEDAVRKSREMLRLVMDNIPQAIFWKDRNSVYMGCNEVFARFAGVGTPENVVGKTDYDLAWRKEEADSFRRDDRRVMDTDAPIYHIIEPQLQAGGKHAWLDTNKIPMHDSEGNVVGILGTYEDITERKNAELELEKSKSQAELYVDLMSHDINNMNQAMMGYLEMAIQLLNLKGKDKELVERPLEIIEHSWKLIDNVKKLRRLETEEVPLKMIDLGKTLSEVKKEYENVPGRNIRIDYATVTGYFVRANEMLTDVFSNLVDNAIKHGHDPVNITIETTYVEYEGKKYYQVNVDDNGPGIPDEQKKNLFVEIKTGGNKTLRRGLGLRLVKTLVENFDGRVWVEDRVKGDHSKGSRFVVMLPAVEN